MSYEEKNLTVSLSSYLLIIGFYIIKWVNAYQQGGLQAKVIFALWATVIIANILVNIIGNILTNIIFSIIHAVKTRSEVPERMVTDERDKLIQLKGSKISYIVFSVGVFLAMLSFMFAEPPLIMFSLIILFSLIAEIVGVISQLVLYRKGF